MNDSKTSTHRSQLPICVITGFPGAGKTSLLNHFLSCDHGLRVGVIVNDFGAIDDESRLAAAQIGISDLVVFNKTDLVDEAQLKKTEARVRKMAPMARFFRTVHGRLPLVALLCWDSIEPGEAQRAPSMKSNFLGASIKASTIQTIEQLTPAITPEMAPAKNTSMLSPLLTPRQHPVNARATLHDTFDSCAFAIEPPLSMDKIRETIMNLPLDIYRLKGLFHVDANPDKQLLIQVVGPRISAAEIKPWRKKPRRSEIVAIGLKGSVNEAQLKSAFESCIAEQGNELLSGLKERAQFWRREKKTNAVSGD